MKRILLFLSLICTIMLGHAQVVRIEFDECDRSMEPAISQAVSIDGRHGCHYVAYANPEELAAFEALNIPYEIDTTVLAAKGNIAAASSIAQMAGWNMYPNYSTFVAMMQNWAATYPNLCKLDTLGYSYNNHLILSLKISDNPFEEEAEPDFLYMSSMHGDEVTGMYFLLRLIDTLLTSYGVAEDLTYFVNNTQLYVIPDANPDGTYKGGDNYVWQPNSSSDLSGRYNGNGVDLNRTYPFPYAYSGTSAAGAMGSSTYQSQYNSTQIENKLMIQFMNSHHFVIALCMHGGAEIMNFPWDTYTSRQKAPADADWWTAMGNRFLNTLRTYTGSASTSSFPRNMYTGALSSTSTAGQCFGGDWYAIGGGWQDYSNFYNHIRAFTLEVSNDKCPYVRDTTIRSGWQNRTYHGAKTYWYYQKQSLINLMNEVHQGVHGFVVDSVTRVPLRAFIEVVNHDADSSQIYSRHVLGDYYRPIADGTYSFRASCPGYITKTYTGVTATYGTPTDLLIELVPEGWVPVEYTVTVESEDNTKGTVSGGGTYLGGQNATISATPTTGYEFDHWNDGNTDNPRVVAVSSDTSFTAYFSAETLTLTVLSEDNAKGTVSGGGDYVYGTTTAIEATPTEHYTFARWQDNNTNNPRSVTVTANATYTAYFNANNYTITVAPNNVAYGTASGSGTFAYGTTTSISATANTGYEFVQWSDGNTDNPRTITVEGNATYTAEFAAIQYTLTVLSEDNAKGTASGSGTFAYGATTTISATPNEHYTFARWNDENTDNPRTVTVTAVATYTAYFNANTYTVTATSANDLFGSVTGSGSYAYNTTATLTATAEEGYNFVSWNDGNTQNPRIITVVSDTALVATFEAGTYSLTVVPNNVAYGSADGSGNYIYGSSATISATPNEGYHFVEWNDGNTDNPRTVTVTGNAAYTATFAINSYTITVSPNNAAYGTTTGTGTYNHGESVTATATANSGYVFDRWSDGTTETPYVFTATQDLDLVAQFSSASQPATYYTLTVLPDNANHGTTYGSGSYQENSEVQISATANTGYTFTQWQDGNTDNPRTVTVTGEATYTAYFAAESYTLTVVPDDANHGTANGSGTYNYGEQVTISAVAAQGYTFTQWQDGNTQNPRTVTVTGEATYTASFATNSYQITVVPNVAAYGTTTGTGTYAYGTQVTIGATANAGYNFTGWNDGNTDNPRTITVTGTTTYTAIFSAESLTITVVPDDPAHGTTTGSGNYPYGSTAAITATAAEGYHFTQWNDGNTQSVRTVTVTASTTYTASFAANNYQITVIPNAANYGTTADTGTYAYGQQVTISATANEGHAFLQWADGNTDNPRTVTVTGNAVYTAVFTTSQYTLMVVPNEADYGTTTGSGVYNYGEQVTISATANNGHRFLRWDDGNTYAIRTVVVTGDATYTAIFETTEYTVNITPNSSTLGSTSGSGVYHYMDVVTAVATPVEGAHFERWSNGSTENPYIFNVTQNVTLIAIFASDHNGGNEGIEDIDGTPLFSLYPNPTTGNVSVQWSDEATATDIEVYNIYGQRLQTVPAGTTVIDLSDYVRGTYLLRVGGKVTKVVKM